MPMRHRLTAPLILLAVATEFLFASSAWAVKSVGDLKKVESQVKELVEKVLPCTVCVRSARGQGSGSGVIVSEDGLVLTAAHVTAAAGKDLVIIFPDGRRVKGKSLGANRRRDAGMAQITEEGSYPFVDVGKSADLKKNDWCISLGHAGGFDAKRTPPVRMGRVLANQGFVVTDCTIVGGDSGGPLFDLEGRVIGIHSNIGVSLSQNQHVPIDVFTEDWDRMKEGETWGRTLGRGAEDARRPVLGVQLSQEPSEDGVSLDAITPGSPAQKAGLKQNDVIVEIDEEKVKSLEDVIRLVQKHKAGEIVNLKVKRGEEQLDFAVKLVTAGELMRRGQEGSNDRASGRPEADDGKKDKESSEPDATSNEDDSPDDEKDSTEENAAKDGDKDTEEDDKEPTSQQPADKESKESEPKKADEGRSVDELMREARKNGGRLKLTPDEMRRLQKYMRQRMGGRISVRPPRPAGPDKWYLQVIEAYKPAVAMASDSTYRVLIGDKQVALATAVASNLLLTKASEIEQGEFEIELEKGRNVSGEVIETFSSYDLALVQIVDESLQPAKLQTEANDLPLGTFLAASGHDDKPAAIGLISVKTRDMNASRGFLGIALEDAEGGFAIREVVARSPAKKAGLKVDDVVTKLNGEEFEDLPSFIKAVGENKPGQQIELQVRRGEESVTIKAKVGAPMAPPRSRIAMMNQMGSKLSDTREGFPLALQHDCPLQASDCGGPLVTLDGDVIGINIARAGRIKSYAVPADVVQQLLDSAKNVEAEEETSETSTAATE